MELVHEITDCQIVWLVKGTHAGTAFFDKRAMDTLSDLFGLAEFSCDRAEDVVKSNGRRTGGRGKLGNGLDATSINRVAQNSDEKHTQSYGGGVGPEWVRRRFEPILLDGKGTVETQPRSKYTELKGGISGSQKSVTIALESEILRVERDDAGEWPVVAHLSDGSNLGTDIILVGTGVLPNVDWLTGSGIELDQGVAYNSQQYLNNCRGGILVSAENMSTNVRGIFAAGDCTTVRPETVGTNWMQMRLWSQAQTAGRACAQSMAAFLKGETAACSGLDFDVFAHATQFFSKKVVLLGRYNAQGLKDNYKMVESGGGKEGNHYIRVVLENGRVRGAILVGEVDKAETFENLILDGLDVSRLEEELVDPSVDIEDYFD